MKLVTLLHTTLDFFRVTNKIIRYEAIIKDTTGLKFVIGNVFILFVEAGFIYQNTILYNDNDE
jgi:hypothetical protein